MFGCILVRCVIVVHPYPLAQKDTTMLTESAYPSCAKARVDDSRFSPDLHKDKRVTLTTDNNTIPHSRTIMYMVTLTTGANMNAVGHFSKIFDLGKNGLQLTDDSVTRLIEE